ncbi:MAG: ComEC family competence protein [Bacteroidales bacterium]|nr:ComEC family competence protein [Bacteroidales bacterium]
MGIVLARLAFYNGHSHSQVAMHVMLVSFVAMVAICFLRPSRTMIMLFGIFMFVFMFCAGFWQTNHKLQGNKIDANMQQGLIAAQVIGKDKTARKTRLKLSVQYLATADTLIKNNGKLIVYADTNLMLPNVGEQIAFYGRLYAIDPLFQPFPKAFNYNRFLWEKGYRATATMDTIMPVNAATTAHLNMVGHMARWRYFLIEAINSNNLLRDNYKGLLAAITLGYKDELDDELTYVFTKTGVVHVLALSGMHTGIIYLMLVFFYPLS